MTKYFCLSLQSPCSFSFPSFCRHDLYSAVCICQYINNNNSPLSVFIKLVLRITVKCLHASTGATNVQYMTQHANRNVLCFNFFVGDLICYPANQLSDPLSRKWRDSEFVHTVNYCETTNCLWGKVTLAYEKGVILNALIHWSKCTVLHSCYWYLQKCITQFWYLLSESTANAWNFTPLNLAIDLRLLYLLYVRQEYF